MLVGLEWDTSRFEIAILCICGRVWYSRITGVQHNISGRGGGKTGQQADDGRKMGECGGWRVGTGERRVQVLFMDYLTCPGYNPPKASIRIIASSSSRLCGCTARHCVILFHSRDPHPFSIPPGVLHPRHLAAMRTYTGVLRIPFFYQPSPRRHRPLPQLRESSWLFVEFRNRIIVLVIDEKQFSASQSVNRETELIQDYSWFQEVSE